jgi:hypothetical protein
VPLEAAVGLRGQGQLHGHRLRSAGTVVIRLRGKIRVSLTRHGGNLRHLLGGLF